jgi:hypothetical protein
MDKMVTLFQVESSRIHDIELTPGSSVGTLRGILHEAGYDVVEAEATVNRYAEQDKLVGRNEGYVLQPGDTVEFSTKKLELPATKQALEEEARQAKAAAEQAAKEEQERAQASQARHAGYTCGCHACRGGDAGDITLAEGRIRIERTPDGIVITVR